MIAKRGLDRALSGYGKGKYPLVRSNCEEWSKGGDPWLCRAVYNAWIRKEGWTSERGNATSGGAGAKDIGRKNGKERVAFAAVVKQKRLRRGNDYGGYCGSQARVNLSGRKNQLMWVLGGGGETEARSLKV